MEKKQAEILAPAGSWASMKAAVAAGADAVYMGGTRFGARAYADNPDEKGLLEAIDYVHLHGRRLYMTVNTLFKESELKELAEYMTPYYNQGLDGVIVQDLGALRIMKENFPGLELHASTQMTITSVYGARMLKDFGCSRVVTSREMSLDEIRRVREEVDVEIESFVHGALCYCYSGQCLMSSLIGGRSGNRGRCAQPCRLPYQTALCCGENGRNSAKRSGRNINTENRKAQELCPLSLKDISTIEILPQILEAGVTSLKIEGRMKQPGYTAGVTSVYRKYLDLLFEKGAENYRVAEKDKQYLLDLFNRGGSCTGYYQMQNGPSMMAFSNEKKTGDVSPVLRKKKEKIQGTFILFPGSPAILDVSCRGIHGSASVGEVQYAQNQPLTEERIRSQMEKLGNTEYEWENLDIQMDENIFIPMKMLNEARREALESLENELLKPYKREENNGENGFLEDAGRKADSPKQKNLPIYISCEEKSTALALYKREGIHGMYLNADAMEVCLDDCVSRGMEMYLSLPHIMRGEMPRELLTRIREWMDRGMTGFLVRNLETFAVLRKAGLAEKCVLDHSMYTWNDEAADFWKDQKVLRNTVPLELNEGEIRHRDNRDSEMLIYGYLPLMISAQCVHKNLYGCNHKEERVTLKDRYDKEFTAKCICNPWKTENTDFCIPCYNIIYNSIPYGLLKEKSQIDKLGVSSLRLAFTIEKPQDAVKIYEEFRAVYCDGKNPPKREYTKGHFKRGAE
mgnify:CR=1 FL=1